MEERNITNYNSPFSKYSQEVIDLYQKRIIAIEEGLIAKNETKIFINIEGIIYRNIEGEKIPVSFFQNIPVTEEGKYTITFNQNKLDTKDEDNLVVLVDPILDRSTGYDPFWQMPRDKMVALNWQEQGGETPYIFTKDEPIHKKLLKKLAYGENHIDSLRINQGMMLVGIQFPIDSYLKQKLKN